ncbi:MAG: S8 family serine peptidase [Gammaproteobacteria bacterium]|nr:S8 family serine peptidase [Gammaproteobacteria bacterium]MBU2059960.1 S8 family serine peptidase [Gammaproteobacteria bacterium]MBU2175785.1 S8 family serine peptidase [Gammaproteobacteria bacterium]MBU2247608.1 S8 family serine peptidase [Gammaproteobacteria bacterium]MBU2342923.1 S8 family serine peptidase [Gammaproteobacteria bacterium]
MQHKKFNLSKVSLLTLSALSLLATAAQAAPLNARASLEVKETKAVEPPTRFIVKYKNAATLSAQGLASTATSSVNQLKTHAASELSSRAGEPLSYVRAVAVANRHVVRAERRLSKAETQRTMELLAQDPMVESVEEDRMLQIAATPNDTQYTSQWHYYESTGGLRANTAWDNATGAGVVVAVLDTGYRPHADLNANLLPGYDMISDSFVGNDGNNRDSDARDPGDWVLANECGGSHSASDSSWHGTHVAGTVAAVTNNGSGVAGVAYGAKVVPVRVLGKCGGYTSDIADGIIWASGGTVSGVPANANPAKVINMSLGGSGACDSTTQAAINSARSRGTVIVIASGNDNSNANNFNPGNCAGVVNVASTNRSGGRAYYSNYGTSIDVAAPGGAMNSANDPNGILSTYNTGTTTPGSDSYAYSQGTSMAAPHVAGVAALIAQKKPGATPDEIETILKTTTRSFPASCNNCGTGIVDAAAAVAAASGTGGGGGTGATSTINNISVSRNAWKHYTVVVPAGMSVLTVNTSGGSGDADLYVRRGSQPTTSTYDCRPYLNGNTESCTFNNPMAATYHISIRGYTAASGITLTTSYQP